VVVTYVIIVYDIAQERVNKVCQFLRQYLNWIQNSVFEGDISESKLEKIRHGIKGIIEKNEDSVIFYVLSNKKLLRKDVIGMEKNTPSTLI